MKHSRAFAQMCLHLMVFSSGVFLFIFLPIFLSVYYLTPNRFRLRNGVLLIGSYVFYAWWRVDFLVLFIAVTAWNYFIGLRIASSCAHGKRWLVAGVAVDLVVLALFKYASFGVESLNALLGTDVGILRVLLPVGISFYIFESISYITDVYREDTEPTRHPVDFATFLALFPHIIAGPVFRYKDLSGQLAFRTHDIEKFGEGAQRFMQGFVKQVFIAGGIAPLAARGFALQDPSLADAWLAALAFTAQLYFDFSGYTDMALGLGLMLGFRFVENFNQPYISQSITEFWRRWHMSLASWLRDYVYISLGGNRRGVLRTYLNKFTTMLLGGLWHGANWTFVLWGAWHGLLLCIENIFGVKSVPRRFRVHRWALALCLTILGWVLFRADSVADAWRFYRAMFGCNGVGLSPVYAAGIDASQLNILLLACAVTAFAGAREYWPRQLSPEWRPWLTRPPVFALFVCSVFKLSAQG